MRLSRPCYDKMHRCPGWAGGGFKYPKGPSRCKSGYIRIYHSVPFWKFRFHRCSQCDVVVWPYHTRWLDPTWTFWWIHRIFDEIQYKRSRRRQK